MAPFTAACERRSPNRYFGEPKDRRKGWDGNARSRPDATRHRAAGPRCSAESEFWHPSRLQGRLALYREASFDRAGEWFEQALKANPGDKLACMYRDQCRVLIENPPPSDWDGTSVMTHK
jgi:hypothetical protein